MKDNLSEIILSHDLRKINLQWIQYVHTQCINISSHIICSHANSQATKDHVDYSKAIYYAVISILSKNREVDHAMEVQQFHPEPESQTFFSMVGYQLDDGSQIFKKREMVGNHLTSIHTKLVV